MLSQDEPAKSPTKVRYSTPPSTAYQKQLFFSDFSFTTPLLTRFRREAIILAFIAFVGSIMVSYIRARAEGLGYKGTSGFLTRPERVVIITVTLIIGQPIWGLWILAVGTPLSAFYRFWAEWRNAR